MAYSFPQDVQQLIDARMASGHYRSEDDVLRDALRALRDEEEDLEAVREAVAELQAGDPGTPLEEAFNIVRRSSVGTEME